VYCGVGVGGCGVEGLLLVWGGGVGVVGGGGGGGEGGWGVGVEGEGEGVLMVGSS